MLRIIRHSYCIDLQFRWFGWYLSLRMIHLNSREDHDINLNSHEWNNKAKETSVCKKSEYEQMSQRLQNDIVVVIRFSCLSLTKCKTCVVFPMMCAHLPI